MVQKKVKIGCTDNTTFNNVIFISNTLFESMGSLEFPIINGKSPEYLTITYVPDKPITVNVLIEEFGGKPSATYFEDGA